MKVHELVFILDKKNAPAGNILETVLVNKGVHLTEMLAFEDRKTGTLGVKVYLDPQRWRMLKTSLTGDVPYGVKMRSGTQNSDGWVEKCRAYFKPFKLGSDLYVIPAANEQDLKNIRNIKGRKTVKLIIGNNFGSGHHFTTKALAGFLEMKRGKYKNVLDIGTGTGILSIIAHMYGAENIYSLDIDEHSVRTAKKNFRLNHMNKNVMCKTMDIYDLKDNTKYDLILSNMFTRDNIALKRKFKKLLKKGGYLCLSGISADNYGYFRRYFKPSDLRCIRIVRDAEWSALLYKKIT